MIMIRNQKGSLSPTAKLTWATVDKIREDYKKGEFTHSDLAKKYKISASNIGRIVRNESWVVALKAEK